MTARILVVDDIPANVKLLEARLVAEYYEVLTATNGYDALDICNQAQVDLVLLDVKMPGIDGFEVCERLKANPRTAHIPVVMVTALDQPADRVQGLSAGADDFLTKPVKDTQLMARVRSLLRLKMLTDELRRRAATTSSNKIGNIFSSDYKLPDKGQILLVDARANSQERITRSLSGVADVVTMSDPQAALFEVAELPYDLVIINSNFKDYDPLRLCSQIRSLERTRFIPMLIIGDTHEESMVIRAMELGVNDYIIKPLDPNELVARTITQLKRKHFNELLQETVESTMELAVTDGLTGMYNRRYMDMHLSALVQRARDRNKELSVFVADIDFFKKVNDTYGHDVGDEVLRLFAKRIRCTIRAADLACRVGGEEFVIIMPDCTAKVAQKTAERLRLAIESTPFSIEGQNFSLPITVSIGAATLVETDDEAVLLKRADQALYKAKKNGRNQVITQAA